MHARSLTLLIALCVASACACVPKPPPRVAPTGETWRDVCANLARLGDPAGREPDCAEQLESVHNVGVISMEPECLLAAETRAQLDQCFADDIE